MTSEPIPSSQSTCPKCGLVEPKRSVRAARVRSDCPRCGRLLGWSDGIPLRSGGAGGEAPGGDGWVPAATCRDMPPDAAVLPFAPSPPSTSSPRPASPGEPQAWLYLSRRLDILFVPNEPPWVVPLFAYGPLPPIVPGDHLDQPKPPPAPVPYYRLTPSVLVWFERAGVHLEAELLGGRLPRSQFDEYAAAMVEVWVFADAWLEVGEVRAARLAGSAVLPERGAGPPEIAARATQVGYRWAA